MNTKDRIKELYTPCLGESCDLFFITSIAKAVGCSVGDAEAIMAEIDADCLEEYENKRAFDCAVKKCLDEISRDFNKDEIWQVVCQNWNLVDQKKYGASQYDLFDAVCYEFDGKIEGWSL